MKILVTGGAGFIGSHVVDAYIETGHEVIIVDDLSTGSGRNVHPDAMFHPIDIRSLADARSSCALEHVFREHEPDVVSHHAAQVSVRASISSPARDAKINVIGALNVLECCRKYGVERVIYASSGGTIYGEPVYLPCDETHPTRPISPYGVSKFAVEQYVRAYYAMYGIGYTILRYGNVYGPRQSPHGEAGVVAIFADQMLRGERPTINGTGLQERDFVHVSDCVRANLAALDAPCRAYNVSSGHETSVRRIFELLRAATGYRGGAAHGPARAGEVLRIFLDIERAREDLGWEPRIGLREGLEQTVREMRDGD